MKASNRSEEKSKRPNGKASTGPPPFSVKVPTDDGKCGEVMVSAEERSYCARTLFFLLAQTYYKMLELVASAPGGWVDPTLNHYYLWVVSSIRGMLRDSEFKDFPGGFEPAVESLYPDCGIEIGWENFLGPPAADFLARAHRFMCQGRLVVPQKGGPTETAIGFYKGYCEIISKYAQKYRARVDAHFKRVFERVSSIREAASAGQEQNGKLESPQHPPSGKGKRRCRSAKKTSADGDRAVMLAALLLHHKVDGDKLTKWDSASQKELMSMLPGWDQASVSRAMAKLFGKNPMKKYKRLCAAEALPGFLKRLDDGTVDVEAVQN